MGKKQAQHVSSLSFKENDLNVALNPSLSYTLNHFVSQVEIREIKTESKQDEWLPFANNSFYYSNNFVCGSFLESGKDVNKNLNTSDCQKFYYSSQDPNLTGELSEQNQKKFLDFFSYLKKIFFVPDFYQLSSANNFPLSAGVASSASSFAALTLATYQLAKDCSLKKETINNFTLQDLSLISRLGSGSACRSFFSSWAFWKEQTARSYSCPFDFLIHQLIVVSEVSKTVSSRQAHQKVLSSPNFQTRVLRANNRFRELHSSLQSQDWKKCFLVCWDEFEDMHNLFESSVPPFQYKSNLSKNVLKRLQSFWKDKQDGPIVTMDAGANIHLLYRKDQKQIAMEIEYLLSDVKIFSSDVKR